MGLGEWGACWVGVGVGVRIASQQRKTFNFDVK